MPNNNQVLWNVDAVAPYSSSSSQNSTVSNSPAMYGYAQCNNSNTDPAFLNYQTHGAANVEEGCFTGDVNPTLVGGSYFPSTGYYKEPNQQSPAPKPFTPGNNLPGFSNSCLEPDKLLLSGASGYEHSIADTMINDIPMQYMIQTILEDMRNEKSEPSSANTPQHAPQVQQQSTAYPTLPSSQKFPVSKLPIRSQSSSLPRMAPQRCMGNEDGGECYRVLLRYMDRKRHRPLDNNIAFWKGFVADFYESSAKKKICFSKCPSAGIDPHTFSFSKAVRCSICRSIPRVGLDTTSEFLHWTYKSNFDSGVIKELIYLDRPIERKLPSGFSMLKFRRAVIRSIYSTCHVVQEGILRVLFSPRLKIRYWEFCVRHVDVLLSQNSVAPQIQELIAVAQKYQTSIEGSGVDKEKNFFGITKARYQLLQTLELFDANRVVPPEWFFLNGSQGDNSHHGSHVMYPSEK